MKRSGHTLPFLWLSLTCTFDVPIGRRTDGGSRGGSGGGTPGGGAGVGGIGGGGGAGGAEADGAAGAGGGRPPDGPPDGPDASAGDAATGDPTDERITIDLGGKINDFADRIGIWINTLDPHSDALTSALTDLRLTSIRYGWQYKVFHKDDLNRLEQRPVDNDYENMADNIGPQKLAQLLEQLKADGLFIASLSGINYQEDPAPHDDAALWSMNEMQRAEHFQSRAADFARWAAATRFKYVEIGNEENGGPLKLAPASKYARYVKSFSQAIKQANGALRIGMNGFIGGEGAAWFDEIYTTVPDINQYIDFFIGHVYCPWMKYEDFRDRTDYECSGASEVSAAVKKHFPAGHALVTEFSTFETATPTVHWRAVSLVNTIRFMFSHAEIHGAQFWGTRWGNLGAFLDERFALSPLGLALKTYTRFMQSRLADQGKLQNLRYMALTDPNTGAATIYLINGGDTSRTVTVTMKAFRARPMSERWRLTTPGNDPHADRKTQLAADGSVALKGVEATRSFTTDCPPISVTVIAFPGH